MTTSHDLSTPMNPRIHIDTGFLLRQVSALGQVKRKRRTWDEFGGMVVANFQGTSSASRGAGGRAGVVSEASDLSLAKKLVHEVLARRDPRHGDILSRLSRS